MSAVIAEFQEQPQATRHLALVPQLAPAQGVESAVMHITRRGRLARAVAIVLTIAVLAVATVTMVTPASAAIEVEVQPGQTLSEIAATHLPNVPLDRAMVAVQLENDMNSTHVQTGQRLVIP